MIITANLKKRIKNSFYQNLMMIIKPELLIGIFFIVFTSTISAADINGRFVVTNTDSSRLEVLLQINTMTGNNALGGATIVFGFDTTTINLRNASIKNIDYLFNNFCDNFY